MPEAEGPGTDAAEPRRVVVVLRGLIGWSLLAACLWFVWPSSLGGCTTLTVVSGHSMEPTYFTGDLVVARCGTPKVGDIVVYHPPGMGKARVIHRLIGGDGSAGWQVKGDNNHFVDPFTPTDANVVGIAVLHVPRVGRIASIVFSPWVWAAAILAAAVLVIWPSDDDDVDDDADDDEGHDDAGHDGTDDDAAHADAGDGADERADAGGGTAPDAQAGPSRRGERALVANP